MDKPLRPVPVLFACRGCEREAFAREVAVALDRRGFGEAYVSGFEGARARARYPVLAIEGCDKRCAESWLAGQGVRPQKVFVLDAARSAAEEAERVAAYLGAHRKTRRSP